MTATTPGSKPVRSSGVLLHPTSLPGPFGIGDLGEAAYVWVNALASAKQTWWQVLPLGPTGYGDSPYQCFSAFAGNPYLISPEALVRDGLLKRDDLVGWSFPADRVDFGPVIRFKIGMLGKAWENFKSGAAPGLRSPFEEFCKQQDLWLSAYALFMALKDAHGGAGWQEWPADLVQRRPAALEQARRQLADSVGQHQFRQFLFSRQWQSLKQYANRRGISLIGDAPIFVSGDSADVWANPELFLLDEKHRPRVVAGVPPDFFSATGQLWGNPLYDWEAMKRTGYLWWIDRLRTALDQVDLVRLDHFRGFEACWQVPAGLPTAEQGRWVKVPGADLFTHVRKALGGLPLIAEDLGIITQEVDALREQFHLPGMCVLQFAFGEGPKSRYLPHHYKHNTVVYTGTHDNDTTRGWYESLGHEERTFLHRYLSRDGQDIPWTLIRLAWSSVADCALAPLQDLLNLGSPARMNSPGRSAGNWGWRYTDGMLTRGVLDRLAEVTEMYSR